MRSVTDDESEFGALLKYMPEMSPSEVSIRTKFEEGLRSKVRRYMTRVMLCTYRNILESALFAERMVPEKFAPRETQKGKRRAESSGGCWSGGKKGRSVGASSGPTPTPAPSGSSAPQSQYPQLQYQ